MARKIDYSALFTLRSDGRYCYTYKDGDKRKYLYDKDPAALYEKVQRAGEKSAVTFGAIADEWWDSVYDTITPGTRSCYNTPKERAKSYHGSKNIQEITAGDVAAVLLTMRNQDYGQKSIKTQRSIYKMIFEHAIIKGHTQYNPAAGLKLPAGIKPPMQREAPELDIVKVITDGRDKPFGMFAYFLLYTGLRKGEALALKWGDINFDTNEILVEKAVFYQGNAPFIKTPKTKAGVRVVPLLNPLKLVLNPGKNDDLVFPGADGKLMHKSTFDDSWLAWCKSVGLVEDTTKITVDRLNRHYVSHKYSPTLTAHQLRHGYATILFEAGVDAFTAKEFMGHADISTTQKIYTHLRKKQRDAGRNKLEEYVAQIV